LILVDTSVWIDFFSSSPGPAGNELRRMIDEVEPIALTGVVVTEILQGLTRDFSRIERFLSMWDLLEPRGFSTYREAAAISRRKSLHPRQGFLPRRSHHRSAVAPTAETRAVKRWMPQFSIFVTTMGVPPTSNAMKLAYSRCATEFR
jgi:predicted nucleic acid-binding protein